VVAKDSPTLLYRLLHDAAKIIFYIDKKKSAISISFLHYLPFFGSFIFPNGAHGTKLSRASSPRPATFCDCARALPRLEIGRGEIEEVLVR